MKYSDLDTLLKTVLADATFHLEAPHTFDRFITWQESGTWSLRADDKVIEQVLLASVFVYTQHEGDTLLDDVCKALNVEDVACGDPVPAYDDVLCTMGWIIDCELI